MWCCLAVLGRIQPRRCFLSSLRERGINLRYKRKRNWLKKLRAACRQELKVPLTSTEELLQWNWGREERKKRKEKKSLIGMNVIGERQNNKETSQQKTSTGIVETKRDWGRIKHLYFKHYVTWLERNSFAEDIEWVPLFSNLHLSEQPPEDSAQTSKTKIV